MTNNKDIRLKAISEGIKLWQIAEKLNITDSTFSRKLRKEFSTEEKNKVLAIIDEIAKENTAC